MQSTEFQSFSQKQLILLSWWCEQSPFHTFDAVICDGAVRSGKTVCMSLSFVFWAFYRFSDQAFALCGKTVTGMRRNVVTPLLPLLRELGFECREQVSKNILELRKGGRTNRFYLFGGKDASSAALIQGMTLAGVMLDEAALMPRSFCEQAIARCSVEGSRLWFNCNPEHPAHWFYREWILKREQKNCLYLHFTMQDNPSLSEAMRERYKTLYSGAFYARFVEGKWVACEGLVYPFFDASYLYDVPKSFDRFIVSCDYGTVNPTSMGLWGHSGGHWYRIDEFYHSSKAKGFQMTDEEYYRSLCTLIGGRTVDCVIVDPSAASFIECIRRHGEFAVRRADNDVLGGIRQTSDALKSREIRICKTCPDIIREFSLYRWDESARYDAVKKENDHAMDDMRYFVATALKTTGDDFFVVACPRERR